MRPYSYKNIITKERGENLDLLTLAVSIIAFAIACAVFFIFPFGFSKKGITIIVITAFLLSLFSFLTTTLFSISLSLMITFLLVLCISYIVGKRLNRVIFTEDENDAEADVAVEYQSFYHKQSEGIEDIQSNTIQSIQTESSIQTTDKEHMQPDIIASNGQDEDKVQHQDEKLVEDMEDWEELLDQSSQHEQLEQEVIAEQSVEHAIVTSPSSNIDEESETSFLDNRISSLEWQDEIEVSNEEKQAESEIAAHVEDWIIEVEQPLPPTEENIEEIHDLPQEESLSSKEDSIISLSQSNDDADDHEERHDQPAIELKTLEVQQYVHEDDEMSKEDAALSSEDGWTQMAEEDSSLLEDMGQPLENDAQPLVENNEEQSQDELPVDEDGHQDNQLLASQTEEHSRLQKQLIKTLLEQLHIYKSALPAHEYEQLVIDHLKPALSKQDYFTFASLLIEHYITSHNREKLSKLLDDLLSKYVQFPVIQEELLFIKNKYC